MTDEGQWEAEYAEYLASDWWRKRRLRALQRARHRCERPGCGNTANLNVHHFSYERLYGELDEDLVVLCRYHHEAIHKRPTIPAQSPTPPRSVSSRVHKTLPEPPETVDETLERLFGPTPSSSRPAAAPPSRHGLPVGWVLAVIFLCVAASWFSQVLSRGGPHTSTPTRARVSPAPPTPAFGAETVTAIRIVHDTAVAATANARSHRDKPTATPSPPASRRPEVVLPPAAALQRPAAPPPIPANCEGVHGQCTDRLQITLPEDGETVIGLVPIMGTALGGQFYKIEVSSETCPSDGGWISTSDVHTVMVDDGLLDVWDSDLHPFGWYWVRLTVVLPDGNYPPSCLIRIQRQLDWEPTVAADTAPRPTAPRSPTIFPVPPTASPTVVPISACPGGCTTHVAGCDIKGNVSYESRERIYHVPGQEYYAETKISPAYGERWFCTEAEAQAAGWRRSHR